MSLPLHRKEVNRRKRSDIGIAGVCYPSLGEPVLLVCPGCVKGHIHDLYIISVNGQSNLFGERRATEVIKITLLSITYRLKLAHANIRFGFGMNK